MFTPLTLKKIVFCALVRHVMATNIKWRFTSQHLIQEDSQCPPVHRKPCNVRKKPLTTATRGLTLWEDVGYC